MSDQVTTGEALIRLLGEYGVDTVFGIPGVHTLELYRGIAKSNIQHVLARNEQGAGFMADGYARASGRPGICTLITGPGVTNAATPLGQSFADSVPVLLISTNNALPTLGKGWGCLHEITDQQAVTAPLTALSATALCPEDVPELIGQAFSLFASSRPRPVHISIPIDVMPMPAAGDWRPVNMPTRPMPDPVAVAGAAMALAASERPVIIAGGGAIDAKALTALAEHLQAAVITSNAGKGIVPDSHPLNLGASLVRSGAQDYLSSADVVLAIGTELAETDSFVERIPVNGKLIRVDIDPGKMNDMYPADIAIQADAGATANALLEDLGADPDSAKREDPLGAVADARRRITSEVSEVEARHQKLLGAMRRALPADAIVMGDITQLVYTGSFALPVEQPRQWSYPAGYCTLGCGMPMAIGAKLAEPERPVIAIAGDGGFMFTLGELAVASELGQSLPILIWNNDGLGQIRDDMLARGIPATGVDSRSPDLVQLAGAFGCEGTRPDSLAAVEAAIASALAAPAPTLIEVRQDAHWLA